MKAMLFAAGLGTRLKPFTNNAPKALAIVNGKTLLEHNISYLQRFGISDVTINVHHFADMIIDTVNNNNGFGSNITISDERDKVLETGGGLKKAIAHFSGESAFVVMNVDVLTNLNLSALVNAHELHHPMATLAVMKRESSRQLLFNEQMELCAWRNNSTNEVKTARNTEINDAFAFSGIQVVSPTIFNNTPFSGKFSLIDLYLHVAQHNIVKGFNHTGDVFIDVGKPESIEKAAALF